MSTSITWIRVGYPTDGEPILHGHGNANVLPHTHVGGDRQHEHRHSKTGPNEFMDEFTAIPDGDEQ